MSINEEANGMDRCNVQVRFTVGLLPFLAALSLGFPGTAAAQPAYVEIEADVPGDIYDQLARHGDWIDTEEFGLIWKPSRRYVGGRFEPLVSGGQWEPSDQGPIFISYDLPQLQPTYEYGKWFRVPGLGWAWHYDEEWNRVAELRYGRGHVAFRAASPFPLYDTREHWRIVPQAYFYQTALRRHFVPRSNWSTFWPSLRLVRRSHFDRHVRHRGSVVLRFGPGFRGNRARQTRVYFGPNRRVTVRRWDAGPARHRRLRVRRRSLDLTPAYRRRIARHHERHPEWRRRRRIVRNRVDGPRKATVVRTSGGRVRHMSGPRGSVTTVERDRRRYRRRAAPAPRDRRMMRHERRQSRVDDRRDRRESRARDRYERRQSRARDRYERRESRARDRYERRQSRADDRRDRRESRANDRRERRGRDGNRGVRRRGEGTPGEDAPGRRSRR
jgi:hypothetical protein